ncbi:hypothetical protein HELRODRAFT_101733 [Helobdella robusta]|uniref:Large ribosomal subunit protein uL4m n=1 Tax=Helobdella robusta TaxID=6412 RepID=T1ED65_HELRO|nr:hypothetical protein HELRODRAFT_101733 [Helobdella robusta]ESN98567.1 hypothetical protein HELRODRAFT_101733 [Helobdella robusta]
MIKSLFCLKNLPNGKMVNIFSKCPHLKTLPLLVQKYSSSNSSTAAAHVQDVGSVQNENSRSVSVKSSIEPPEPVMRLITKHPVTSPPRQAWLETLSTKDGKKLGLIDLHSDIFGVFPRVDVLWQNVIWQQTYRKIDYRIAKNRAEMRGGGHKPWPQKGTGRARHGSIRSPIFIGGGKVHGPRGPTSYFYMLPHCIRLLGLKVALSVKYAQGDLHVVDSLELPSPEPEYLEEVIEAKGWGLSVLFIDNKDIIPKNIAIATSKIDSYNVMPSYGLNVYSLLKHETVVFTLDSLLDVEGKLLQLTNSEDFREKKFERVRGSVKWQ